MIKIKKPISKTDQTQLTVALLSAAVTRVAKQVGYVRSAQHLTMRHQTLDQYGDSSQILGDTHGVTPQQRGADTHAEVTGGHEVVRRSARDMMQHAQEVAQQRVIYLRQLS